MKVTKLLLREIWFRKTHFVLSLLAVIIAATLFVAGPTLVDGYGRETTDQLLQLEDETRKLMRDMGFNLMIVHRDTNMADFWDADFSTVDMPQEYVDRLAAAPQLTLVTHLVATLQQKIKWNDRNVLLKGYLPEATQTHLRKKKPMGYDIKPGTVFLGYELGVGREAGETVEVLGKSFTIARILPEGGSKDDIMIAMSLQDAQEVLGKPSRVNQILALGCHCAGDRLGKIRSQLETILPETRITEFRSIAVARGEQRDAVMEKRGQVQVQMETLAGVVTPLVILVCAVWLGLLALANVRERRMEIGVLRALGVGSFKIATLFLGKAVLLGVLGAVLGALVGTFLAFQLGVETLGVSSAHFTPAYDIFLWIIIGAPLVSAMASYVPTLIAVLQDPAVVLREE